MLAAESPAQEGDVDALLSRAVVLQQTGDLSGAAALYVQVLRVVPAAARVRSNLGAAYAGLGRFDEAIVEYRRALETEQDNSIRQNLTLALLKAGRLEEAADEADRMRLAQPENRNMVLVAADCRLRLGQSERVVELLQPVSAAAPDDKTVAFMLGTAMLNLGRTSEAELLIDRVFRDDSPEGHLLLATLSAGRGDCPAAVKELDLARARNPQLPQVNYLKGSCLKTQGDWAGAAEAFRRELEIDASHYESNLNLGNLLREEGRYEEALVHLLRAARVRGDAPIVKFSLGALYVSLGRMDEARHLLEEVQSVAPTHVATQVQLAIVYTRLGLKEEAVRARENATRLQKKAEGRTTAEPLAAVPAAAPRTPASAPTKTP